MLTNERPKPCRCNCGYRCGGPGRCILPPLKCLQQNDGKHFVRDCEHQWDGEWEEIGMGGSSVTCSKCGASCMAHDARYGP